MPSEISTQASVTIEATAEEVWRALTTPELIKRWFFGVDTETDWSVGGPIVHRGEYQGTPYEDTGMIERFEPGRLLVHTHWSPVSGLPDRPENHQEVTWALSGADGVTELTVTERNLPSEQARETSDRAWTVALAELKRVVEERWGPAVAPGFLHAADPIRSSRRLVSTPGRPSAPGPTAS